MRLPAAALALLIAAPGLGLAQQPAEHPMIGRLRALLGPEVALDYHRAAALPAGPEGVRLSAVTLRRPDGSLRAAEVELEELAESGAGRIVIRGLAGEAPAGPLAIGRFQVDRLAITRRPGQEVEPQDLGIEHLVLEGFKLGVDPELEIARITLSDFGAGQGSALAIEGFSLRGIPDSPVAMVSLSRAAFNGLDLAALLGAAVRQEAPPAPAAGHIAINLAALTLAGPDGTVLGGAESLGIEADSLANMAGTMRFALRGVRVERSPLTAPFLDMLELGRLDASLSFEAGYEPAAGRLSVPALAVGVRELGALGLGFTLDGWTPEAAQQRAVDGMRLVDARLRYADEGLYARAVESQAREQRATPQQVRDQHAQMVAALLTSAQPAPGLDSLREALLAMVRGRAREVEVTARPSTPLPLERLQAAGQQGPAAVARLLGVSASAR